MYADNLIATPMKQFKVRAASDTSWLDAARQLIATARQEGQNLRSLHIKEDRKAATGKYCLKTKILI
jgi:flavin-binding protein dodecin